MNWLGSMVIAFSMYSRIPMPKVEWTKERMRYAMCYFPLIGAVIGLVYAGYGMASEKLDIPQTAYACMGTVIPLLITGGIHMDGYLDTCDARSSYVDREKKLEILNDPHTGAFALIHTSRIPKLCGRKLYLKPGAVRIWSSGISKSKKQRTGSDVFRWSRETYRKSGHDTLCYCCRDMDGGSGRRDSGCWLCDGIRSHFSCLPENGSERIWRDYR